MTVMYKIAFYEVGKTPERLETHENYPPDTTRIYMRI